MGKRVTFGRREKLKILLKTELCWRLFEFSSPNQSPSYTGFYLTCLLQIPNMY